MNAEQTVIGIDRRFLGAAALLPLLLTTVFARWTATSVWSFPLFLGAVWLLIYLPGTLLLPRDSAATPVERAILALVLGMGASAALYLALRLLQAPWLFWAWPVIAACTHVVRRRRAGWPHAIRAAKVEPSLWLLLGLLTLECGVLAALPGFYSNFVRQPDGTMTFDLWTVDSLVHVSLATELVHSINAQVPFFAGESVAYHYGMDLIAAMLADLTRLSVLDLVARFLPTLFLAMTTTAAYACCARWLGSGHAGVLAAALVGFAEDLSFVPGAILRPGTVWSAHFFGAPTTYSLYVINPMLPALAILFSGLLCLLLMRQAAGWTYRAAFLFAMLWEFKVFTGVHALLALVVAGGVLAVRNGERSLLKVALGSLVVVAPLVWYYQGVVARTGVYVKWTPLPWPYIPEMLRRFSWTALWRVSTEPIQGSPVAAVLLGLVLLFGLAVYLLMSLGLRTAGVPGVFRTLARPNPDDPARLVAAVFVVLGPFVSLLTRVTAASQQYNDSIWFYVQSKQLIWPFALEALWSDKRKRSPWVVGLGLAAIVLLTLPSTVQFLWRHGHIAPARLARSDVAFNDFLRDVCEPGDVVFVRPDLARSVVVLTHCHVPFARASFGALKPDQFAARLADQEQFWRDWRSGTVRWDLLERYKGRFILAPTRSGDNIVPATTVRDGSTRLTVRTINADFSLFEVSRLESATRSSDGP